MDRLHPEPLPLRTGGDRLIHEAILQYREGGRKNEERLDAKSLIDPSPRLSSSGKRSSPLT